MHDEYPGHWLSFHHSIQGKTGYRAPIVSDQNPALVSRPIQNGTIVGLRQSHILDTDQVDVRQSPDQAAHDVVVEVLVTQ